MRTSSTTGVWARLHLKAIIAIIYALILMPKGSYATVRTSVATGNWSASATWNPAGEPGSGDTIIIHGGNTVTIDSIFTCQNLAIGDATSGNATLQITTAGNSLTVNGALSINPNCIAKTYTLNAGPGTINVAGTFPTWCSTAGTNNIKVSTGTITFTPAVTISANSQAITFTGAGTINFNSSFTDDVNGLSTSANCTVNFASSYMVNTTDANWGGKGTAIFAGTGTIAANSNLTLYNMQLAASASTTLASDAGTVVISGAVTLGSASTFTVNENFELDGNWSNSGGTFSGNSNTVYLNGTTTITGATAFPNLQIGLTGASVTTSVTVSGTTTCTGLTFTGNNNARSVTVSSGDSLTVNGNVLINHPTAAVTNNLAVNSGTCIVTGTATLNDTSTTTGYVSKITVTTGLLNISGAVSYAANTIAANQLITLTSTGTITLGTALNLTSGTFSITSTGTVNFNGAAPSFAFGGTNTPVFTTTNGCSINFTNGFTNNSNSYTFAATSNATFTGNGSITANANITFGNVQMDGSDTLASTGNIIDFAGTATLAPGSVFDALQSFELAGNWTNNGGSLTGSNDTVFLIGNTKTIGGSMETAFPVMQVGNPAATTTVTYTTGNSNSCSALIFYAGAHANKLTLGNGDSLTVSGAVTLNQPTAAVANELLVNAGICNITNSLNLPGTVATTGYVAEIVVTSGNLNITGNVNIGNNTRAANSAITVSTGTITFSNPLTVANGTLSVTGAGTVNFNGSTPSFTFGGSNAPKFTTTAGCTLNFAHGFINNTTALVISATSYNNFNGTGTIVPNAQITFGNVAINSNDTISSGGAAIMAGNFTLASGALIYAEENFEVRGDWVNNGGTLSGTTYTVFLNGASQSISGNPTTFQTLEIGNSTVAVSVAATMGCNNTCSALIFQAGSHGRALTLNSGTVLTVNGNLTIAQPTGNSMTNILEVGAAICNVSGNLIFSGSNSSTTRVAKVDVTSGSFSLTGSVTWGGSASTAINVISVNSGTINFSSSIAMGTKSGTMQITGAGIINFNGATAPSLSFGGAVAPVFTAISGSTVNLKNGFTTSTTALTLSSGSNTVFKGTGTLTPGAALTLGNIEISPTATLTAAGSVSVTGNWVDSGTFVPSAYGVTLNGSGIQTISESGSGETFYQLTVTSTGTMVELLSNITITNALTMNGANINLNNYTLTLGSGSGAALTYVGGIAYGGNWKRWFPATAITSNSGSYYGLFPIGTSTDYRYVYINSISNPTTPGYVSAQHYNVSGATGQSYIDNGGSLIEEIADMHSDLTVTSLAGGSYNLTVHFTGFSPSGNVSELKLETYTGNVMGSAGVHVSTIGTVSAPTLQRDTLSASQLANAWVAGTNDKYGTPLYSFYFSRKTSNWSDTSAWSFTQGGGTSCGCTPLSTSYAVIDSSNTITVDGIDTIQYIDILNDAGLATNNADALTVTANMTFYGTSTLTNNGTLAITGALTLPESTSSTSNGNVTVDNVLTMPSGSGYTQTGGTLTLSNDVIDTGTITIMPGASINLNGSGTYISGTATFNDSTGTINITNNKVIASGTTLTLGTGTGNTTLALATGTTVNNSGSVTLNGSLTGASGTSYWINNAQSALNITGSLLNTGTFDPSTGPNTVNYDGSGSQIINSPSTSYYNLTVSNSGTKTMAGATQINNALTISGSAILNDSIYTFSGNAALNMSGTSQLTMQRSTAGVFPELVGIYSLPGGTVTLNQTGDSSVLASAQYYNLVLNGSVANDISGIYGISNNFNIQNSATLNNNSALTIGGSFTYASTGSTTLSDNITTNGISLNSGTLNDGGLNITVNGAGGWNENGGTYTSSGQAIFYSSSGIAQAIGGNTATNFNNLVINNPTGVTLNVNPSTATLVTGNLNLTRGNLITSSTNILNMLDTASVTNASDTSYVSGPMTKTGNNSFIFPVGNDGILGQAGISELQTATTQVTAQYFHNDYSNPEIPVFPLTQVSLKEYWNITRTVTTDSLQLQLFWQSATASNIIDCSYLTIAYFTGGKWLDVPASAVNGSDCSGTGSGSVQSTYEINQYGPFTFGGTGGDALPIELVSFTASPQGAEVITNWVTDIEINNAYFTIERSADAINFTEVGKVDGAGNSTVTLYYQLPDPTPLPGVSYYRLRQTDYNGNSVYSKIVSVYMPETTAGGISVYPNPAHNQASVTVSNPSEEIQLRIFDISGLEIYTKTISVENSPAFETLPIPTGLFAPGVYLVSTFTGNQESNQKLVIQ